MKKLLGIVVALFCGVLQAEDFYWSGKGGDGRWDNVANWATNAALTSPAARCPAAGLKVYFILDTFENHEVSVIVPDGAAWGYLYVKDDTAPGSLKLFGEPMEGKTRAAVANSSPLNLNGAAATSFGVTVELENIDFEGKAFPSLGAIPNTRLVMKNCSSQMSAGDITMPKGIDSSVAIIDSEILNVGKFQRDGTPGANFSLGITNSTIVCSGIFYFNGLNTTIDVLGSDLSLTSTMQFGNSSADANFKVKFANTKIRPKNTSGNTLKANAVDSEFIFDHVDFSGDTCCWKTFEQGSSQVWKFINSDFCLNSTLGSNGKLTGTIYLDNSVFGVTNRQSAAYTVSTGSPHFVISGKRTMMFPGARFNSGSVSFDFIVPEGGFDHPPVGCDGDLAINSNQSFFNSLSGGQIRVLSESPAARVPQTAVYPLVYVYNATKPSKYLNLAAVSPTQVPNEESEFLASDVSMVAFSEVSSQPESWWTQTLDLGATSTHAGLAIKIVGRDVRQPAVTSLSYAGLSGSDLTFVLELADMGELPTGGVATTVTPRLIYRPVGEETWVEVPQPALTTIGRATLVAPKHGFTDGNYEIGVRLVNDIEGRVEYIIPDAVEIAFSRATISELGYVGEGIEATITGTVTGTGSADSLPAILEVSESEDFADIKATYELGLFTHGAAFEKTVIINPGVMTYYRVTVGEGSGAAQATVSGVSRTVATLGEFTAVNTNGLCRVVVDGMLTARGAGDSTVKLRYSMDGENWKTNVVGTIAADGTAFTGACAFPMDEGTAYYEILVENTSGDHTWVSASGVQSLPVKDTSTYYWRDVEGEWDGNWNDGRHWYKPDLPDDVMLYPRTSRVTASFRDCPTDEGVTVTLPENVTVKEVGSTASSQKLTFSGSSSVTLTAAMNFSNVASEYVFDGLAVECPTTDVKVYTTGNSCSYAFTGGAQARFKSFGTNNGSSIQLTIGEDAVLTLSATGGDNGSKSVLVDNGKLVHAGFVGQNYATATVSYRLRGKKARVEFTARATYLNNAWKNVQFIFEIPEGGYDEIPVQLTNGAGSFLYFSNNSGLLASAFCKPGDDNGLIYAIADNSPALLKGQVRTIEQDLFLWNKTGFAYDHDNADEAKRYDLLDYTKLQVPETTSAGRKVKNFSVTMRGVDDVEYASPAAIKAAGTTAYAVSYHIRKATGVVIIVR